MTDGTQLTGIAADPTMPKIGQRVVGRYDVVRLLGQGGFAAVFEAVDSRASGHVAIKVLHAEKSFDESFAKRFRQEVMLVRQLQHPNTIKITDAGTTETGCLFMVMEYVQGKELVDLMQKAGPMPHDRAIRIGEQVLKALSEAHSKGIVHRDLKPQNIMVGKLGGEEDYVKVLDFGIAKALEPDAQLVQTQAGMVFCTPKYAAPEILMARGVTPAADVYALGLIILEMLTGQSVIDAPSEAETIARALSPEPIPIPPDILNTPLGQVLSKACAKTLQERYQNADEMLADLRKATQPAVTPSGFHSGQIGAVGTVSGPQAAQTLHYQAQEAPVAEAKSRTGLIVFLTLFGLIIIGAVAAFALGILPPQSGGDGPADDAGGTVAAQPDVGEEDVEVNLEPEVGPFPERVAVAYGGEAQQVDTTSAQISMRRLVDETALLNQLAMNMISEALVSNEIPPVNRAEAQAEYLQVVGNLVKVMSELQLCEGASRRLDRAFNQAVLVPPNAAREIAELRRTVQGCRADVESEEVEWDSRDFIELVEEANDLKNQAMAMPEEQQAIREARFFEALETYEESINMVVFALENDELRSRQVEDAQNELFQLYQNSVLSMLELGLRVAAEDQLDEMLDKLGILPDEAVEQVTELRQMVTEENQAYLQEQEIAGATEDGAAWSHDTYKEVVQLAERLYTITRGGSMPTRQDEGDGEGGDDTEGGDEETAEGETEAG